MTPDGVYKLISRRKLKAVRRSERKTLVPRPVLNAYQRRLQGDQPATARPPSPSWPELAAVFEQETGRSPAEWVAAWKKDQIDDTIENMQLTAQALSICIGRASESVGEAPSTIPTTPPGASMAPL
jgi:hypothetical protein